MLLLAIDTSALATAALLRVHEEGRSEVLASFSADEVNAHAEVLAPAIGGLLEEAGVTGQELDRIIVGVGPGPFTGLRVGLATADALGFAWDVPVAGVMSLDSIAWQVVAAGRPGLHADQGFTVAIDARRRELYWAQYDAEGQLVDGPHVSAPDQIPAGPVAGVGAALYADALAASGAEAMPGCQALQPSAAALGASAVVRMMHDAEASPDAFLPPTPLYLREADAKVPAAMKRHEA